MPLTSLIMASHHMKSTHFDNFDIDGAANLMARKIVSFDAEFEKRMKFHTCDKMEVKKKLGEYDCIFLATLVGMSKVEKMKFLGHIWQYMKDGGVLLVRSANGARAFLYPVIEENELMESEVLSLFHPTNDRQSKRLNLSHSLHRLGRGWEVNARFGFQWPGQKLLATEVPSGKTSQCDVCFS
ncbi:hypothetical protein Patl1_14296 [Pistacia atlantica]|uniref:Uncharacterized protein n=1 Tax=Pistacia atlantica TaxID=434234 RepID=A0ACC1AWS0_9ROSI|nr:hypothetical protein Patl1_14296 [Pistacia atlantica]